MTAAVTWLVIWLVVGLVGTYACSAGVFFGIVGAVAKGSPRLLLIPIISGVAGVFWLILWLTKLVIQIITIVHGGAPQ